MKLANNKHIIFHIDGDAFFASCEQSTDMSLRGKPIAVGRERGVATAFSYEAKALGITRGMSGKEIKQNFPSVLLVSSDYRKYGLYSHRFKNIVRDMTGEIEGTSVDECYTDVSHMVDNYRDAEKLAKNLQNELCCKLGMTFSIGVGPNKTIAKIATGMHKPRGITVITNENADSVLYPLHISQVSGIGFRTVMTLEGLGIYTIDDLLNKPSGWSQDFLSKPYRELIMELRGDFVKPLELNVEKPKGISKIRAFAPATRDKNYLRSEFARNIEIVAKKMHRQGLQAKTIVLAMKIPQYDNSRTRVKIELTPKSPMRNTKDMLGLLDQHFDNLYLSEHRYRATYVSVHGLRNLSLQQDLFGEVSQSRDYEVISELTASLEKKYGPFVLHTAASIEAVTQQSYTKEQAEKPDPDHYDGMPLIHSIAGDKVLYIPYLGVV